MGKRNAPHLKYLTIHGPEYTPNPLFHFSLTIGNRFIGKERDYFASNAINDGAFD